MQRPSGSTPYRQLNSRRDARQAAELTALSQSVSERINAFCKDLGIHQEDIAAFKTTICTVSSRINVPVETLDRQADAVRCDVYRLLAA